MEDSNPTGRSFHLGYKARIEALKEEPDFESQGDMEFLYHPDPEARLLWAFYRPSGSHPDQVSDSDVWVSIMAFNHSRLRPLERFSRLHPEVIADESLRVKVAKRARMLFRALADEDFTELLEVLERWPVYISLACDQIANGRKMNEELEVNLNALSGVLVLIEPHFNTPLLQAIYNKLPDFAFMEPDEVGAWLERSRGASLHPVLERRFEEMLESYCADHPLHLLQKIALKSRFSHLYDSVQR